MRGFAQGFAQLFRFDLQARVLIGQVAVDFFEVYVGNGIAIHTVDTGSNAVGRGEPHASLIMVETEEKREADNFEHEEEQEIMVFAEKFEEIVHVSIT